MLQQGITRAMLNEHRRVPDFSGELVDPSLGLQSGDIFTLPSDKYIVCEDKHHSLYTIVENQHGIERKFYPVQITRVLILSEGYRIFAKGTVAEFARNFVLVKDLMDALKGKTIKVSNAERYKTINGKFRTLYTFDFVD